MAQPRFWQMGDLPDLERMMIQLTWGITPAEDRAAVGFEPIARSAVRTLHQMLGAPGGTAVVAEDGGRPVGFLLVSLQQDDRTGQMLGYLADIYIDPAYRGRGLSKPMERMAVEHLRQLGMRHVYVWVHAHNPQGQATARRLGMQPWGVVLAKELRAGSG